MLKPSETARQTDALAVQRAFSTAGKVRLPYILQLMCILCFIVDLYFILFSLSQSFRKVLFLIPKRFPIQQR